jgi:hypothetical protein
MAPQPALEKTTRARKPYRLLIVWPIAAAGIVVFWNALYWQGLKMSVSVATLTSLLAPVAFGPARPWASSILTVGDFALMWAAFRPAGIPGGSG